jgi:hypothetical protein
VADDFKAKRGRIYRSSIHQATLTSSFAALRKRSATIAAGRPDRHCSMLVRGKRTVNTGTLFILVMWCNTEPPLWNLNIVLAL